MAKSKCEYCESYMEDIEEFCPVCNAVNPNHQRTANDTPQTIEQLKSWYIARKLPPEETTRFFIGKDIKEPKAFGIYEDKYGNFVVYKNKANGQRAVRYKGNDEAYAVNELYLRLKEEILNQKSGNLKQHTNREYVNQKTSYDRARRKEAKKIENMIISFIFFCIFAPSLISIFFNVFEKDNTGYYCYDNTLYYFLDDEHASFWDDNTGWYKYDNGWKYYCDEDDKDSFDGFTLDADSSYYIGSSSYAVDSYNGSMTWSSNYTNFEDTEWYNEYEMHNESYFESSSDWSSDSDYDWDSGSSWDSGSTDWDSDW